MNKFFRINFGIVLTLFTTIAHPATDNLAQRQSFNQDNFKPKIFKKVLNNGFSVLVNPTENNNDVSVQLWVGTGSKEEQTDEKGLAHLLEHTVFKGTKNLSESDIGAITQKLSGSNNAYTSYDHTRYIFEVPQRHWQEVLPILSDCMSNCTFKQDLLNSEFKAVIQELKMNNDNYAKVLLLEMMSSMFPDHPYHYPVVGYKQHIWNATPRKLLNFYKKHYIPNNAALVVVGKVNPQEVFALAQQNFGHLKANPKYKKKEYFRGNDISSKTVTIYRDVKKPSVKLAFVFPGLKDELHDAFYIIQGLLFNGSSSRLYQKLIEELKLVNNFYSFSWDMSDHSVLCISFDPKDIKDSDKIISIIQTEISNLLKNGITPKELKRVINQAKIEYYKLMSKNAELSNLIGEGFICTGNEYHMFEYYNKNTLLIENEIKKAIAKYMRPAVMHKGYLLPISAEEKNNWQELQKESDEHDGKFLESRIRESEVEPCKYANNVIPKPIGSLKFAKPKTFVMNNGIKVYYHNNNTAPIVSMKISLKANDSYDNDDTPIHGFMSGILDSGSTQKHSAKEIAQEIESLGSSIFIMPGEITVSCLSSELEPTLNMLNEILTEPKFDDQEIEKTRQLILASMKSMWDNPTGVAYHILYTNLYKGHPYGRNLNDQEKLMKVTKNDIIEFYKKYISPKGAKLAIVGDLSNHDVQALLERTLGKWDGPEIEDWQYRKVDPSGQQEFTHHMNRDQVAMCFANLSVDRMHPDFNKLLVFSDILTPDSVGGKLFELRELTGLFYTIGGSAVSYSSYLPGQPGLVYITTIVSPDKVKEAEDLILNSLDKIIDSITEEDIKQSIMSIINGSLENYSTNHGTAETFLFLDKFGYPFNYYENRIKEFENITVDEVKTAARKFLNKNSLVKIKVGRI